MQTTPEARPISLSEYGLMRQNERITLALDVMTERGYQSTHGWHGGHNSLPVKDQRDDD